MSDIIATNNIVVCPNPFTMARADVELPTGLSVRQMVELSGLPDYVDVIVTIDGDVVPQARWDEVFPAIGQHVAMRAVPTGGGGKNPLRTILMIVVTVVAAIATAYVGGAGGYLVGAGFSASAAAAGGAFAGALVATAGMLAVNAIAPPPTPSLGASAQSYKDSPSYALSGARNTMDPYGPIPMLLGHHRITPKYAALPYTENRGDDQYLYCYFAISSGKTLFSDLRIGETPLSEFTGVEMELFEGDDDAASSLYPSDVNQTDLSIVLENAGGWHVRTTEPNTTRISVDATCPRGLVGIRDDGGRNERSVQLEVQYSVAGAENWKGSVSGVFIAARQATSVVSLSGNTLVMHKLDGTIHFLRPTSSGGTWDEYMMPIEQPTIIPAPVPSWAWGLARVAFSSVVDIRPAAMRNAGYFAVTHASGSTYNIASGTLSTTSLFTLIGRTTSAIRRSFSFPVVAGQYDVRMRRITADSTDDKIVDTTMWTALRSFQAGAPVTEPNLARFVLCVKGTDQLNGIVDQFNLVGHTVCPDWDTTTSTWIERATVNPASLYRHVLQGPANKRPMATDEIDLDILIEWHDRCRINGWRFSHYFDYRSSVETVLQMIAAAGRATPGYGPTGKFAVVMDRPQTNIAQYFTPRNTWGYRYSKVFLDLPHAFRIKFWNRDKDWREDELLVYDDGYSSANATKFEELSLPGIDSGDLAFKHGRYHFATAKLRPEVHKFYADAEQLTCTRGDRVMYASDVIAVGLGYGRIKSLTDNGTHITHIAFDEQVPMAFGRSYAVLVRNHDGEGAVYPVETVAGFNKTFTLATPVPIASAPDIQALALFGESYRQALDLIVKNIIPMADLAAEIVAIAYAPEVHTADEGPIPPWESGITLPLDYWSIYVPIVHQIYSDETAATFTLAGDLLLRMKVVLRATRIPDGMIDRVQIRYRTTGTDNPYHLTEGTGYTFYLDKEIDRGDVFSVSARFNIKGQWGKWSPPVQHTIAGVAATNPPDVTGFRVAVVGSTAYLTWDPVSHFGLRGYVIRFSSNTDGATWTSSTPLTSTGQGVHSVSVGAMRGTYLIKAFDYGARRSVNAVSVVNAYGDIARMNVVEYLDEDDFLGAKTDTELDGSGQLILSEESEGVLSTTGSYAFANSIDLGEVFTCRIEQHLVVGATNLYDDLFVREDFFAVEDFFDTAGTEWNAWVEMRTTTDDPVGTPTWSGWDIVSIADSTARAFQFRAILESETAGITPVVSELGATIDMPDRIISDDDLTVPAIGLRIDFTPPFLGFKGVGIAAQELATGDYYKITTKDHAGFNIRFFNSGGTGVERTFDYVAAGYGRRVII